MLKSPKKQPAPKSSDENSKYPFFGAMIGLFSLNKRLSVAHADLENSAPQRSELIKHMEKLIVHGQQTNKLTKERIVETDQLITESKFIRNEMK